MTQHTSDDLWRDFPKTATEFEKRFATEEGSPAAAADGRSRPPCCRCRVAVQRPHHRDARRLIFLVPTRGLRQRRRGLALAGGTEEKGQMAEGVNVGKLVVTIAADATDLRKGTSDAQKSLGTLNTAVGAATRVLGTFGLALGAQQLVQFAA